MTPGTPPDEEAALEAALAAAVRGRATDIEAAAGAEEQAVAAFRAARDNGAHAARTRRRDDWRPREQRLSGRSLKATFAVLLASVTLGGVAVAAIGSSSDDGSDGRDGSGTRTSTSTPDRSGADATEPGDSASSARSSSAPSASPQAEPSGHPSQAKDTEAHCRAYESVRGRGNALNSTAWQRLITAAGGEANVAAYCAEQLGEAAGPAKTKKADPTPSPATTPDASATAPSTPKPTKSKGE